MISDKAYIAPGAKIGKNVTIYPFAYIEDDVVIGDDCIIANYSIGFRFFIAHITKRVFYSSISFKAIKKSEIGFHHAPLRTSPSFAFF